MIGPALARTTPAMQAALAWGRERSRREQILIAFFGGFLALTLFWFAIPRPLLEARATALSRIETYETIKARVAAAGPGAASRVAPASGPIESVITARAAQFGLSPSVERADGGLVVTVSDARYDSVIPWLAALEGEQGAVLSRVRMERGATPGVVNLEFRIAA